MLIQKHTEYFARIQSYEKGTFSNEYNVKIRFYNNGILVEEEIAVDKSNFDKKNRLIKLVSAKKQGEQVHIVFNSAGCGGNDRLNIPIEDLLEELVSDND